MKDVKPWSVRSKSSGHELKHSAWRWDTTFIKALHEIAEEEKERFGLKELGLTTLLINLATERSAYFTEVRRRLNERDRQLSKEKQRHAHQIKPTTNDLSA